MLEKTYRHADVTDAPIQQQRWQVWWGLPWSCSCTSSHPGGNPGVGVHLIPNIECFCSEQLLHASRGLSMLLHKAQPEKVQPVQGAWAQSQAHSLHIGASGISHVV